MPTRKIIRSGRNCHRFILFIDGRVTTWMVQKDDFVPGLARLFGLFGSINRWARSVFVTSVLMGMLSVLSNQVSYGLPTGWEVVSGEVVVDQQGSVLNVTSQSNKAVINYQSFNIGTGETVNFKLPSQTASILNRILGNGISQIDGALNSNGTVLLVNPRGIRVGETGQINVGSLIASSLNIQPADYLNNQWIFQSAGFETEAGWVPGTVTNDGVIETSPDGLVALLGESVSNHGVIQATEGQVHLAVGDKVRVAFSDHVILDVTVDEPLQKAVLEAQEVQNEAQRRVENQGLIEAKTVKLQAELKETLYKQVVNNSGIIHATTAKTEGGSIRLSAASESSNAVVENQGLLVAQGNDLAKDGGNILLEGDVAINTGLITTQGTSDGIGGKVQVLGDTVVLGEAGMLDASGGMGGGEILIGGDYQGQGKTRTAETTVVSEDTLLLANAWDKGDGGRVIVWGNDSTYFSGTILARGGESGGNGGFVETSGKEYLSATGQVDLTAAQGEKGTYLLDPANITIYGNFDPQDVAGNVLWYDGSDIDGDGTREGLAESGLTGNLVDTVVNKAGGGGNISAAGTERPIYGADQLNSLDTLTFDGSNDRLTGTLNIPGNDVSMFVLYNRDVSAGREAAFELGSGGSRNGLFIFQPNNPQYYSSGLFSTFSGAPYATGTFQLASIIHDATDIDAWMNGAQVVNTTTNARNATTAITVGDDVTSGDEIHGNVAELVVFDNDVSTVNRELIEQYISGKWDIALTPPGIGATEVAQATASDGYSAFTTDYLNRLSQSADISLLATNTLTLDLQGDTLSLANDRSLNLSTTNGNITSASAGTIQTNRTGTGGNITFNAGGGGNINLTNLALNAQNGGNIQLTAGGGTVTASNLTGGNITFNADTVTLTNPVSATGTVAYVPVTPNATVGIGNGTAGAITYPTAALNQVSAGTIQWGDATTTGNIELGELDLTGKTANVVINTTGNISDATPADDASSNNITVDMNQNVTIDGNGGGAGQVGLPNLADLDIVVTGTGTITANTTSPPT
nr:filamentous hemagglutinin N-terminal domain-containing protein [Vampirovibrio sp.]